MRLTSVMQNQNETMAEERGGGEGVTRAPGWDVTPTSRSRSLIGQNCAYYHVATLLLFILQLFRMR